MFLVNREGRVLELNRAASEATGQRREDLVGRLGGEALRCVNAFINEGCGRGEPCKTCAIRTSVEKTFEIGEGVYRREGKLVVDAGDGPTTLCFLVTTAVIGDKVLVSLEDTTRLQSEQRMRDLTSATPAFLYEIDRNGTIRFVNRTYPGLNEQDVVGTSITSWIPDEQHSLALDLLQTAFATGARQSIEYTVPDLQGEPRTFLCQLERVVPDDRDPYVVLTAVDITERKRMAEFLEETRRNLTLAQSIAHLGSWRYVVASDELDWSEELYRIHGLDPETTRASLEHSIGMIHPDDRDRAERTFRDATEQGRDYTVEYRILRPDGEERIVEGMGKVEKDGEGNPVAVYGTGQDITEHRRAEQALRDEKERAQRYLDVAAVMLLGLDRDGRINLVNRCGCEVLGVEDQGELLGKDWFRFVPEDDREAVREIHRANMRGEADVHRRVEGLVLNAAGEQKRIVWHNAVVRDQAGRITGSLSSGEDVTARKELEAQLAQADRLSSMGMLAAGVAHEINNPLTYVLYNLQTLADDLPALVRDPARALEVKQIQEMLERIEQAVEGANRVRDIVRDLKTFTRADDERLVPVSLNDTIETAISMAQNEIKYRARLEREYGALPTLTANDGRLAQVFLNLVVNAAQSIEEGDVEHNEIRVRTRADGDHLVTEVSDTGAGIAAEDLPRIFDPFFTTKKVGVGSGLGLSICHSIVTSMGGTIRADSEPGNGARFTVRIPITHTIPAAATTEAPVQRGSRGRFLIVDDEAHVGEAIQRMIADEHDGVAVTSGKRAMAILERDQRFDGIICDLMMPDVTGMDLHAWLQQRNPGLADRMLFVTGGAFTPRAKAFLRRVENPRLEKPFDPAALKAWLRRQPC
jgi:PAS domain S-box-containing protein